MGERWVMRDDGVLQCVDDAGSVIAVQKVNPNLKKVPRKLPKERADHHYVLDSAGRTLWVPVGTNPDDMEGRRKVYPFSEVTWEHVCQHVTQGKTLKQIGTMEGFPPDYVLYRWMRKHEAARSEFEEAKKARADYRYEQAVEIADKTNIDPEDVPAERLRSDIYKWAASVDAPDVYGKQTKIVGDPNRPVVFHVSTGVPEPKALSSSPTSLPPPEPEQTLIPPSPVDFTSGGLE